MDNNKIKLVMLLANWYSGATLFTILVNNHSQIVSNGETFPFSFNDNKRYLCSCGNYLDDCEFYRYAASHMWDADGADWNRRLFVQKPRFSGIAQFDRYLNSVRYESAVRSVVINANPFWKAGLNRYLKAQHEFFLKALEYSNALVYMDGMKSIRRAQLFARDAGVDLKVINLVRDGRAFCYSYVRNEGLSRDHLPEAANYWNKYLEFSGQFRLDFPDVEYMDVRYEDVCHDREQLLGSVYDFIGVKHEPAESGAGCDAHILGHAMRKSYSGNISERTEWKDDLSAREKDSITSEMRPYLEKYGYV